MSLINMISEIIIEEKKFKKKYELLIFLKELEEHMINLMNTDLSDSDSDCDSSETNESDITDEEYEIDKETEHGIDFFMLK